MDRQKNRTSLWFGVPGLLLQVIGVFCLGAADQVANTPDFPAYLIAGGLTLITGTVLLIVGLAYYAQAKGHHWAMGLLGCLGIIGLLVLALLPDQEAESFEVAAFQQAQRNLPPASVAIGPGYPLFKCLACQYALNGVDGTACPECGAGYDPNDATTMQICAMGNWGPGGLSTSMATTSMVLGIVGLVSVVVCLPIGFILSPMAVIFGHIARHQAKRQPSLYGGRGSANTGVITGYIGSAFCYGLVALMVVLAILDV